MALTSAFYEAIKANNTQLIRIMMKNSLLVDPTFSEFIEMEKATNLMNGLYDEYDGDMLELDKEKWDDDYMARQMVQVVNNFSHERIEHLKDVVSYLRPVERIIHNNHSVKIKENNVNGITHMNYEEQKRRDQKDGKYIGAEIATGAVVGAVAGGVDASVAGVTVAGGAVAGAVIGGATATVVMKGSR